MHPKQDRQMQLETWDVWLLAHPGLSWVIAAVITFAVIGAACVTQWIIYAVQVQQ